jgi:hypothetical protein
MTNPSDIELRQTCGISPEQYDAYLEGRQIGYLRLRHGEFRVDAKDDNETTVYEAEPDGDGSFTDDERGRYLSAAKKALADFWNQPGRFMEML